MFPIPWKCPSLTPDIQFVLGTGKYLGLSSMIGWDRTSTFSYIKDHVWKRINSWSSKCLSKATREVMISSSYRLSRLILWAYSSYLAHYYRWENDEQILAGPQYSNNCSIRWMSCEELPMHKVHDDMGFKDLPAFNLAMLGKQGWKFQTYPHSLAYRIFEARYSLPVANLGYNSSYVWRNFLCACFICLGWCAVVHQTRKLHSYSWWTLVVEWWLHILLHSRVAFCPWFYCG